MRSTYDINCCYPALSIILHLHNLLLVYILIVIIIIIYQVLALYQAAWFTGIISVNLSSNPLRQRVKLHF